MNTTSPRPTMNQGIFHLGLSIATVSAYLLCCSLSDAGEPISRGNLHKIWNGSEELLAEALAELQDRHIIEPIASHETAEPLFELTRAEQWRRT